MEAPPSKRGRGGDGPSRKGVKKDYFVPLFCRRREKRLTPGSLGRRDVLLSDERKERKERKLKGRSSEVKKKKREWKHLDFISFTRKEEKKKKRGGGLRKVGVHILDSRKPDSSSPIKDGGEKDGGNTETLADWRGKGKVGQSPLY